MWRCTSVAAVQRLKNTHLQDKTKGWIKAAAAAGGEDGTMAARKSFVLPMFPYRPPALVYALNIFPFFFLCFFCRFSTSCYLFISRCFFFFPLPACSSPSSAASACRGMGKKKMKRNEKGKKKAKQQQQQHGALVRRRRRKMSERRRRRKQTGRRLSVFLCEVIMCSPRCFCSHANEVDRVGNHFQTLNRGGGGGERGRKKKKKVEKAKQRREQRGAPPL